MKQFIFLLITIIMAGTTSIVQAQVKNREEWNLFIGTYTKGKSEGIYTYTFNSTTGDFSEKSVAGGIKNPSFLALSPDKKYLYAIHETEGGAASGYEIEPGTGQLRLLNTVATKGANSCYVSVSPDGKFMVSGNYSGGNLSVHAIEANGSLSDSQQVIQHTGKGPDANRQEAPHVHATDFTPDAKMLLVCDLGIDQLVAYPYHASGKKPLDETNKVVTKITPGAGPRHLVFHPNHQWMYILNELNGKINAFSYENKKLTPLFEVSILPEGFSGKFGAAEVKISPDGRFLYASNRIELNEIVVFRISEKNGALDFVERVNSGGKTPRFFEIDPTGNFLLSANQDSDQVTVFKRDIKTGKLTDTGKKIEVGAPTCLVFAPVKAE